MESGKLPEIKPFLHWLPHVRLRTATGDFYEHRCNHDPSPTGQFQPTIEGSVYVKPQEIEWQPTQFKGISIKVLYEDKVTGEMKCFLKWEPGATLPMHKHPAIEQSYVIEGSFYDHDGICRAGEFVWRRVGSFHETHSDEGGHPCCLPPTKRV
jgi:anti-sigma factor ChrR (cupin superfamily)